MMAGRNYALVTGAYWTFTVTDGTEPVLIVPDNITIECGPNAAALIEAWESTAYVLDGCDGTRAATFTPTFAVGRVFGWTAASNDGALHDAKEYSIPAWTNSLSIKARVPP